MKYIIKMLGDFPSCTTTEEGVCALEKTTKQKWKWYYSLWFDEYVAELLKNKYDV